MNEETQAANAVIDGNKIEDITETENANGNTSDTPDVSEEKTTESNATKAFSERLKREKQKLEQVYAEKQKTEMNKVAVARGFKDWDELEKYSRQDNLKELGIENPEKFDAYVDELISKNPTVMKAQQIIDEQIAHERDRVLTEAISEINKLDPDIKTVDDLTQIENYDDFYDLVQKGYTLPNAYKVVAFDKITANKVAGATQKVITNISGKNHFQTLSGGNTTEVIVPEDILASYHKNMPDMSDKEIREHYAKYLKGVK